MTAKLSVNINKFATLRNARGGNNPDLVKTAIDAESFGAQGITVHPRPDERHIRYQDVRDLTQVVKTEFNIEGNPNDRFIELVLEAQPAQVTLVPDAPDALTSNQGWDCIKNEAHLTKVVDRFKSAGIRTSIFLDPDPEQVKAARQTGTDRIELYTERYAKQFAEGDKESAVAPFRTASEEAKLQAIGLNAGHDLDLQNLRYFNENVVELLEVSIGHALICDAVYLGFHNTIAAYLNQLKPV